MRAEGKVSTIYVSTFVVMLPRRALPVVADDDKHCIQSGRQYTEFSIGDMLAGALIMLLAQTLSFLRPNSQRA
ncbi:hypothetical protein BD626DRAFT_503490 [Schizophyllum amplum]|uniref:Uncharacterized protein n=1 Tax=Schizophyllum amplum TaxID=97359 RepID=A0A550C880_9AGAR|nr:hypothetical protein BD626DRAFT_503490 [Auriculariopsis ampla]